MLFPRRSNEIKSVTHPIPPVWNSESRILILGTMPSPKSREIGFFYMHPQNRFWKVLSEIFDDALPETVDEKKLFLERNRVALWDVIGSCDIEGSSDSSIRNVVPNDISVITGSAPIRAIYLNGGTSFNCFRKYLLEKNPDIPSFRLPSTSPANARFTLEMLVEEWRIIRDK